MATTERMTTPTKQLSQVLNRARKDGWNVAGSSRGRLRLTHPKAALPVFAKASTKVPADLRALEQDMQRALGPLENMPTPTPARANKAALKSANADDLRAMLEQEHGVTSRMQSELAEMRQENAKLLGELSDFRALRALFQKYFGRAAEKVAGRHAEASAAAPARKTAETRRATTPSRKASGRKAAAPSKAAGRKKVARKAEPSDQLDLEEHIEAGRRREADDQGTGLTAPDGRIITRENAGAMIKEYRSRRNETQVDAARALKCSVTTLINWEKAHRAPQNITLGRVARFLESGAEPEAQSSSRGT